MTQGIETAAPEAKVVGMVNGAEHGVLADMDLNSPETQAILQGLGASAAPNTYALIVNPDSEGKDVAQAYVNLDPNDFGTRVNGRQIPFSRHGLPQPADALKALTDTEAAAVREPINTKPDAAREAARQMSISAADRANREAAGLPPRTYDLR